MNPTNAGRALSPYAALAAALLIGACDRAPPEVAARERATAVEDEAHRSAEQLRTQATTQEHQADLRAEQIRAEGVRQAAVRGPMLTLTDARARYAEARCERENGCNNIGQGRRYTNREACVTTASAERFASWDSDDCTRTGVDAAKLGDCLNAVRAQSCGNPVDDVARVTACRGAAVCGTLGS